MRRIFFSGSAAFLVFLAAATTGGITRAAAGELPEGFQQSIVFDGLTGPTAVAFASDGRVFVAERGGTIQVFSDLEDDEPTLFADLSDNVYNYWDRGMLGLALHPDFPAEPYVYVLYTYDGVVGGPPGTYDDTCLAATCEAAGRLSRLEADGDVMVGDELVLLEAWCQQHPSHSIGGLVFGLDGALYASGGDGASFWDVDFGDTFDVCDDPDDEGGAIRSQDLRTGGDAVALNGTILRLDPLTGDPLPDNPLYGGTEASDDGVIAFGLRNPFRMTVHPETGELWIGDVGWSDWEEINHVLDPVDAAVENFGWPCYEGELRQPGYDGAEIDVCEDLYDDDTSTLPHFAYAHWEGANVCGSGTSAVSGLAFYMEGTYPKKYHGALFFVDHARDCMSVMLLGTDGLPDPDSVEGFMAPAAQPVDLKIGPGGDLFYVDHGGTVRRIEYFPFNIPPVVVVTADVTSGIAPLTVSFDGTLSSDPDSAAPLVYAWDLDGDGALDDGGESTAARTFEEPGTFSVTLRVTDEGGAVASGGVIITVDNSPPTAVIHAPASDHRWRCGEEIMLAGEATDPEDGLLTAASLTWNVILHHCDHDDPEDCHEHELVTFTGNDTGLIIAPNHEYPVHLEFRLAAADNGIAQWWDPSWQRRRRLVFENKENEDLIDFPVLVLLKASRIDYEHTADAGADLRFVDSDGTLLAHEIERWDPTGDSFVWVRVRQIDAGSANDFIWLYYGNPDADGETDVTSVWDDAYAGVWHLGSSLTDSTLNANDCLATGTQVVTGWIGKARDFDGTDDNLRAGSDASLGIEDEITLEAWIKISSVSTFSSMRIISKKEAYDSDAGYELRYNPFFDSLATMGSGADIGEALVALNTDWHYVAATQADGVALLYVDGEDVTTDSSVTPLASSTQQLRIGRRSGGAEYFDGRIDEVRISSVARSPAWIITQHQSMRDDLITFEGEQTRGVLTGEASVTIEPETVDITFESDPPGIPITAGELTHEAPFAHTFVVNASTSLAAPETHELDGSTYAFVAWAQGGARVQPYVVPESAETLTAIYTQMPQLVRGDTDGNGAVNILDALFDLRFQFQEGAVFCRDAHDVNDDGRITIVDPVVLLRYLFIEGPAPAPPSACGIDTTVDAGSVDLGCDDPRACE